MSLQPKPDLSPEDYLALERSADFKSEYFDGGIGTASSSITANWGRWPNTCRSLSIAPIPNPTGGNRISNADD